MGKRAEPACAEPVVRCPSCGEVYDSRERIREVLRNAGYCVNLTCLADLSHHPLGAILRRAPSRPPRADRYVG